MDWKRLSTLHCKPPPVLKIVFRFDQNSYWTVQQSTVRINHFEMSTTTTETKVSSLSKETSKNREPLRFIFDCFGCSNTFCEWCTFTFLIEKHGIKIWNHEQWTFWYQMQISSVKIYIGARSLKINFLDKHYISFQMQHLPLIKLDSSSMWKKWQDTFLPSIKCNPAQNNSNWSTSDRKLIFPSKNEKLPFQWIFRLVLFGLKFEVYRP